MHGPGDQVFAHAGFTRNQDRARGGRDAAYLGQDLVHGFGLRHTKPSKGGCPAFHELIAQGHVLIAQGFGGRHPLHQQRKFLGVKGFAQGSRRRPFSWPRRRFEWIHGP